MSNSKGYIELKSGADVTIVDPKTKRTMYKITDCNKHCCLSRVQQDVEEYCSIKKINQEIFGCILAMEYIENNSINLNIPETMKKEIRKIHKYFQDLLESNPLKGKNTETYSIKDQFYQIVTIYEKEKNPFMDSNQNI